MEKQQTALQELIAFIDEIDADAITKGYIDIDFSNACNQIKEKALLLIDKEKEQIEEAWNDANGHSFYEYGSEYYTNTYTDETK